MNPFSNSFVQAMLIALIIFLITPHLKTRVEKLIKRCAVLPDDFDFSGKIIPSAMRVIFLNWYTYLMLFLLWFILFRIPVGKDTIETFLTTVGGDKVNFGERLLSYLWLFSCTFLLSISTWVIPFFLYSDKKREDILKNFERFYLSTKLLALVAMLPFLIISNAFLLSGLGIDTPWLKIILINLGSFVVFILFVRLFTWINRKIAGSRLRREIVQARQKVRNTYVKILLLIILFVTFLALIFSIFGDSGHYLSYRVGIFIFTSSIVVFRLLFFSDESSPKNISGVPKPMGVPDLPEIDKETDPEKLKNIRLMVSRMLSPENKKYSRCFYFSLFGVVSIIVFFYFLVPSLDATNTLFIIMIVFSFFIFYLDFWRNCIRASDEGWKSRILKSIGIVATAFFLVLPFVTKEKQFSIPLREISSDITPKPYLEDAVRTRLAKINEKDSSGNIYIICAMGGGSRAGYFTAATLNNLDSNKSLNNIWERTLCFSTVSGGSVGAFNFIKGKQMGVLPKNSKFLYNIYQKNYNSSGVFGILLGDPVETLLGDIASGPRTWISKSDPITGFHDRNYRIRQEYDYILEQGLKGETFSGFDGYWKRTFYPYFRKDTIMPDLFQSYFIKQNGEIPIHLINTFEINSGRRAVVSPFPVLSLDFFPNAIKPLQDTSFDCGIARKDILYREAVNLSELFPFISAASHIGYKNKDQFVDGGYYENYGVSTALDVFHFLKSETLVDPSRIKLILIKNSKQEPEVSSTKVQVIAPLIGAMQAPFTGHANHLWEECKRVMGKENVIDIVFDADAYKVPLTRALTSRQIDSLNAYFKTFPSESLKSFIGTTKNFE